ncbi:hypothetical protein GCM10011409_32390 [Lentibacillus populi]|uniref:PIN domain-containing protein n=1 Tax=Lentibacillus populi TaxID=1827502 RepID=A0A9W5X6M2_9BACI|nr:hypothetical protein GCM10011409_32390 [Lentibacillus populi]
MYHPVFYTILSEKIIHIVTVSLKYSFIIAGVTTTIRNNTLQLLEQYRNHKISYCDALSVAMIKEQQIHKIFAFDYHFETMGVEIVRL